MTFSASLVTLRPVSVFVDGDDVAMDGAAVNRAEFVFKKHDAPPFKRTCGGQKV